MEGIIKAERLISRSTFLPRRRGILEYDAKANDVFLIKLASAYL